MFTENLRETRKFRGMTQSEIASRLNISTSTYGDYERGRTEPDLQTLREIAIILDVSIDYLLDKSESDVIKLTKSEYKKLLSIKEIIESIESSRK